MAENFFGITDTGIQRESNEDTFIAEKVLDGRFVMACVVDGVGGYEGGEIAAAITRSAILDYFSIPSGDIPTMMREALALANEKIIAEKERSPEHSRMACVATLAVADTGSNNFYYAHVGDTRLYLLRDRSLVKITKDHSFVGFLEDSGRITEEAAMSHPKRNEINKALGFDTQMRLNAEYIESGQSPFLPGDVLLLCSDGLTDLVPRGEMTAILTGSTTLEEAGTRLVEAANKAGGKDNITVVLVQNNTKAVQMKATKPAAMPVKKNNGPEARPEPTPVPPLPPAGKPVIKEAAAAEVREIKTAPFSEPPPGKNRTRTALLLSGLCLLLAVLVWLLWPAGTEKEEVPGTAVNRAPGPQEKFLQDTLDRLGGDTLFLSFRHFPQATALSDTLFIRRDTLFLQGGGGTVFRADSSFTGPGFFLGRECRYILLENITFENFDVALLAQNKALRLKNVRFVHCRVPVEYQYLFPDSSYVSGSAADTSFSVADSAPRKRPLMNMMKKMTADE